MTVPEAPQLGYSMVLTWNLERMRSFYAYDLGLPIVEERDGYVKLNGGSVFIALRRPDRDTDPEQLGPSTQLAFATTAEGVDMWHERLVAQGVSIVEAPADRSWGHRTLFASDPDGNLIEFYGETAAG